MDDYIQEEWIAMVESAKDSLKSDCPLLEDEVLVEVDKKITELKASKKAATLSAHLAGQADAGVDPSYSNAQCYLNKVEKSDV